MAEYPKGNKQLLTEMGPEKFAKHIRDAKQIYFTDTTFRDGHQSLLATRVRTQDMLAVADGFAKSFPQLFSMEVWQPPWKMPVPISPVHSGRREFFETHPKRSGPLTTDS
jgi:hypothetical protein